jgi:hypothetical protein
VLVICPAVDSAASGLAEPVDVSVPAGKNCPAGAAAGVPDDQRLAAEYGAAYVLTLRFRIGA